VGISAHANVRKMAIGLRQGSDSTQVLSSLLAQSSGASLPAGTFLLYFAAIPTPHPRPATTELVHFGHAAVPVDQVGGLSCGVK